jgi:hypothetical protein
VAYERDPKDSDIDETHGPSPTDPLSRDERPPDEGLQEFLSFLLAWDGIQYGLKLIIVRLTISKDEFA